MAIRNIKAIEATKNAPTLFDFASFGINAETEAE